MPDSATLEDYRKIAQIVFFTVGVVVSILTYRKARTGLLNTVNTEYQKRVMDRLKELSDALYAEFEDDSESSWTKNSNVGDAIQDINETFKRNKAEVIESGFWPFGIPVMPDTQRLHRFLGPLESDPFVPKQIRDTVIEFIRGRLDVLSRIYGDTFEKYSTCLAKQKQEPVTDLDGLNRIHNAVVEQKNKQGCGVTQIQQEVHEIRKQIQQYFESFYPR